jgi:catechol 2,3-dioxygenase-like lactoylglutathione lyase family enzyme
MQPISEDQDEVLRMRGIGTMPWIHETRVGDSKYLATGLQALSLEDLQTLAKATKADVVPLKSPEGGYGITLFDPDGLQVEVVAGQQRRAELSFSDIEQWNTAADRKRAGRMRPLLEGKAIVVRLGHVVLRVSDLRRSEAWWKERFGFITSDEVRDERGEALAIFMRCDRGDVPTDHHTLLLSQMKPNDGVGLHHAAFEVRDFDDLMRGHEFLGAKGYEPGWGIGRHVLGGQIFDYWLDPFGNRLEHWTDGDLFTAADGSNIVGTDVMYRNHWGPPPSAKFVGGTEAS